MGSEWSITTLGRVVEVTPKRYLDKGVNSVYISMQQVEGGERNISEINYRSFTGSGSRFKNGDTLLARITPCLENGKTAYVNFLKDGEVGHGSTEFIVLSAIEGITDNQFVYYLARYPEFRDYAIIRMEGSSGRQRVPASTLNNYTFLCPPIKEQRAIAHILGSLDDKIELNRRMNETLEQMARAIFKTWFVDFDQVRAKAEGRDTGLPDEIAELFPDGFEQTEMGEVPRGWEVGTLKDIATLQMQTVQPKKYPQRIWEYYSIPAFDERKQPHYEKGENIKSGKYIVPNYSVLASKLNPQFPRVWLPNLHDSETAICSTEFMPFVPINKEWRPFLYELLKSQPVQSEISNRVTGSTGSRQRVKPRDIALLPCIVPSEKLIEVFCQKVGSLHSKQHSNIRESYSLGKIRDLLLPKIISGDLRVPDVESLLDTSINH